MATKLGSPQTTKFSIGTAELRIGRLQDALVLTQPHSVGLIDNATVEVSQESVDLEGGFPKVLVDTAVVSQTASITATLREYSRRNLRVLLGAGVVDLAAEPADVSTTVATAASATDTSLVLTSGTGFAANDVIIIYGATAATAAEVQVIRVTNVVTDTLTLDSDTPLFFDVAVGAHVYKANQVAIGSISETNYFSCQVLQLERATGRPIGFLFWKGSIGAGMTFATNAEDFASTELNIKLLQPSSTEYATGTDPLYDARDLIPTHPTGMYFGGGD